ncbi:hypothetical protein ISJ33_24655 [Burkholderia pseudomallei]|nr:hypothetical protein [Burkholderia pseudomallei]
MSLPLIIADVVGRRAIDRESSISNGVRLRGLMLFSAANLFIRFSWLRKITHFCTGCHRTHMTTNIDAAKLTFDHLRSQWEEQRTSIETEQDARFRIVNVTLTDILGWPSNCIRTEKHIDDGYVDYLLIEGTRNRLAVEAKRQSVLLVDTRLPGKQAYKIKGPALKSARSGIAQVAAYCSETGAPFCALTNGFEWIGHWPFRGDGRPASDYSAIVFPSLEAIAQDFAEFYDLFSREGVARDLFKLRINAAEGLALAHHEPLRPLRETRFLRRLEKNPLARELSDVLSGFFSAMNGEDDPEMLTYCFVESTESREAESNLQKIAQNILRNIELVSNDSAENLQNEIRGAVELERKEFVLIVGNKGSGKSTFVDRFFRLTLDRSLRNKCTLLTVDLRDSDGQIESIQRWLTEQLITKVECSLFPDTDLSYEQLQGVFHKQYTRWAQGEFRHLHESNKITFKIKFGEHVHNLRTNSPKEYLQAFLAHAVFARQQMPCLVFDNTDHFNQEFQEAVFQYAQSIYRAIYSFIICPVTDRTIWQLSKHGPMQSYETKSFYLPVPSTKDVLQKRVSFLKEKLLSPSKQRDQYFLSKGIRLSVGDMSAFAACVEEVFINTEYVSRTVSWLCNYDIRRGLQLSKQILTSPQIPIDDLVKTYVSGRRLTIPEFRVKRALFLSDYNQFRQEDSEFILNIFTMFPDAIGTPFAKLSIIQALKDKQAQADSPAGAYMEIGDVAAYLEPMGMPPAITVRHFQFLMDYRLVEPYDPTINTSDYSVPVKVTPSGLIHLEFALADAAYLEHVGLTTAVREDKNADKIRNTMAKKWATNDAAEHWDELKRVFAEYMLEEDLRYCVVPEQFEGQRFLRSSFRSKWVRGTA